MKKAICSVLCMGFGVFCYGANFRNPEDQYCYDSVLAQEVVIMVNDEEGKRRVAKSYREFGEYGFIFANGHDSWPYEYWLEGVTTNGVLIKAINRSGKRTYIYDSYWNVVHYVFKSPEEGVDIGRRILRWMVEDDLSKDEEKALLQDLEWRGLFTSHAWEDYAKYDVLGCLGDFLVYDELKGKIWAILQGGPVYKDDRGRELCLRSILSNFNRDGCYPDKLKAEVLDEANSYIKRIRWEEEFRTKDIESFIWTLDNFNLQERFPKDVQIL